MKITAIVPVYNNVNTVLTVLNALNSSKIISEIIVCNDSSKDNSLEVINNFSSRKIIILNNSINLGKGGTVVKAIKIAENNCIFLCDADLSKLSAQHIDKMIEEYSNKKTDMIIGYNSADDFIYFNPFLKFIRTLSGQRILNRNLLSDYLDLIKNSGNGMEQIINFALRNKSVKLIDLGDIGHILKYQRKDKLRSTLEYLKQGKQIFVTDFRLKKILSKSKEKFKIKPYLSLWHFDYQEDGV
ncbi:MAG: glycosyltransferase [bacterium]